MCIAVPARVISADGNAALVEVAGVPRQVLLATTGAVAGSWVLIYSGIAMMTIPEAEALQVSKLLRLQTTEPE